MLALLKDPKVRARLKNGKESSVEGIRSTSSVNERLIVLGVFILVAIALNLRILLTPGVPSHGDLTFPTLLDNYLDNYLYLFNEHGSISNLENVDRALFLLPLALLAKALGLGTDFLHKAIYVMLPLLSFISMASLTRFVVKRLKPSLIKPGTLIAAGLLYGLSPWAMEQLPAYLFWLAYSLTPLMIMLTIRLVESPTYKDAAWLAVVVSLIASTPQYLLYSLIIAITIGSAELIYMVRRGQGIRSELLKRIPSFSVLILLFVILNFYWIYPVFQLMTSGRSLSPGYAVEPTMTALFSSNSSPLNVLRGYDQWITWYRFDPALNLISHHAWVANSLVLPILAFTIFVRVDIRRNRHIALLAFLGLGFGLLALGTTTPLYDWLVFRVPVVRSVGWIFRVPGKLSYVLWVFYAIMGAVLVGKLMEARIARSLRMVGLTLLVATTSILIVPKVVSHFFKYYLPVQVPHEYVDLTTYLSATKIEMRRVLYLAPYDFGFGENLLQFETSHTWNPSRLAAASPAISSPVPSIGYYHLTFRDWQAALYPSIYPGLPEDLGRAHLGPAGVRYLVYHNDIIGAEARGEKDLAKLQNSDLREVATFGDIHVFENPYPLPIVRPDANSSIEVDKIDPTRYDVTWDNTDPPTQLILAQPYDATWVFRTDVGVIGPEVAGPTTMAFSIPEGVDHGIVEYFPQPFYRTGLFITFGSILVGSMIMTLRILRNRFRSKLAKT